ncbi:MAG: hypothetical protein V1800_16660 [Candidatus Latescibacterota bacterium]
MFAFLTNKLPAALAIMWADYRLGIAVSKSDGAPQNGCSAMGGDR